MLSKQGDKVKLIVEVEIINISNYNKGFNAMLPDNRIIWIDQKYIDSGKIIVEE